MTVKGRVQFDVTVTRVLGTVVDGRGDFPTPAHAAMSMIADEIGDAAPGDVYAFPAPQGGKIEIKAVGDES